MKKNKGLVLAAIAAAASLFASCNRDYMSYDVRELTASGKGGTAVLRVTPAHHDRLIDTGMVYIKYNTMNQSKLYDDSAKIMLEGGTPVAIFSGLKGGNYYLYGKGWDRNINQEVIGGRAITVTQEGVYFINLAVTEGD